MVDQSRISCDVPSQWKIKMEEIAAARNKTSEEILSDAIALYLGEDIEITSTRIKLLEAEVSTLRQNMAQLTATVNDLQQRLTTAASIMSVSSSPLKITAPVSETTPSFYEEMEDEPDEILYDFLESEQKS